MCGRFYVEPEDPVIRDFLEKVNRSPLAVRFRGKYAQPVPAVGEIFPSAVVPVIALNRNRERKVFPMKWGFSMKNASEQGSARLVINARSESAGEKPMFRDAWAKHRCVIPASWYFEWEHLMLPNGKKKTGQKYAIQPKGQSVLWLAGLYRLEEDLPVFTILTRTPSEDVRWMHDRMPLMLPESTIATWISPDENPDEVQRNAVTSLAWEKA